MSEPSAKRQRLDSRGRFSPASPPFEEAAAKARNQKTKPPVHPRTPTSPPFQSMSPSSNGGSAMTTAASSGLSQPTVTGVSQPLSQAAASATSTQPILTPASITVESSHAHFDSDGDATMDDRPADDALRLNSIRHTNHQRQAQAVFSEKGGVMAAEGISGSRLFRVGERKCEMARPHPSQNLIALYGLEPLARSVARIDPTTGEKINKLRKSYEGHIKTLQIAGKPKAVKMEGVFAEPLSVDPETWHAIKVQGKEMERALTSDHTALHPDFGSLLESAIAGMAPGPLPNAEAAKLRTYIGTDEVAKPKPQDIHSHRVNPLLPTAPTPGNPLNRPVNRPERAGSKRHYTDATFQGYGEGYGDDYAADSTGGEDNAQGNAKRRKLQFERPPHSVEVGGARR